MPPTDPAQPLLALPDPSAQPGTTPHPATALADAARALARLLDAGRRIVAAQAIEAVADAWRTHAHRGRTWASKDAYDAAEGATVIFVQCWAPRMAYRAAGDSRAMLRMVERVAALEPAHTHRSERQVAFDQFSTPLPIAYAAARAAHLQPGDVLLEPSAGTGVLAAFAAATEPAPVLHLNELAPCRRDLLAALYPHATVTGHNAERIRDRLPDVRPDVVLLNPPFGARAAIGKRARRVDLLHLRSAYAALAPCGRLVAIVASKCLPGSAPWNDAFPPGPRAPRVLLDVRLPGELYRRRGTSVETRFLVLENAPGAPAARYPGPDPLRSPPTPPTSCAASTTSPNASFSTTRPPICTSRRSASTSPQRPTAAPSGPPGDPARSAYPRPATTPPHSLNPQPWPTSPPLYPPTARYSPAPPSTTRCSPTPSSRASPWPAKRTSAYCPHCTASPRTMPEPSPSTSAANHSTPPTRRSTSNSPPPCASARDGCSATAPGAARDASVPP